MPAALAAVGALGWLSVAGAAAVTPAISTPARLAFTVRQGAYLNQFLRQGPVAAHLVLRSGTDPRLIMAFPAGDSGVGVWFKSEPGRALWSVQGVARPVHQVDSRGRSLYGMSTVVTVRGVASLEVRQAVLSSIRVLRDYEGLGTLPAGVATPALVHGRTISWSRERLDGAAGYRLSFEVLRGRVHGTRVFADRGEIRLRVTGLTGDSPLTPLHGRALLLDPSAGSIAARDTLTFLSYRQKLLAGSWHFDTYFGRDTLMSVRLLMPALSAQAIDDALDSVFARLSPQGEVAHEEGIGEEAVIWNRQHGRQSAAPFYDYKMIDEDYMLAPDVAAWLLDPRERAHAAAYLAAAVGGPGKRTGSRGAALVKNLRFVLMSAAPFAREPSAAHLIGLKPGEIVGDWRDSGTGLGGGHYPYDVNVALVPAALDAAARLYASGLLTPYLQGTDQAPFAQAAHMAQVWTQHAPPLFTVTVPHATVVSDITRYAASLGIPSRPALAALGTGALRFPALSLSTAGKPIAVMQSDEGYVLLFGEPSARQLAHLVTMMVRPFPAGLMTGAGLLVANPAYAPLALQPLFSRHAYHGTVVWSWQQALLAAGIARQLGRTDLPAPVRARLRQAQRTLWAGIEASRAMANAELWSWTYVDGRYHIRAFGSDQDVTESDAAQLWSTVYLAIKPPSDLVLSTSR